MQFEQDRILRLAGLNKDQEANLLTESASASLSDEVKLRKLIREELAKILKEKQEVVEEKNMEKALKQRDLQVAFGSPGYASGMVHGGPTTAPPGQLRRGALIPGIGFHK